MYYWMALKVLNNYLILWIYELIFKKPRYVEKLCDKLKDTPDFSMDQFSGIELPANFTYDYLVATILCWRHGAHKIFQIPRGINPTSL